MVESLLVQGMARSNSESTFASIVTPIRNRLSIISESCNWFEMDKKTQGTYRSLSVIYVFNKFQAGIRTQDLTLR